MSGAAFEGLGGMLEQPSDEGYEPGHSVDQGLVQRLLEPLTDPRPTTYYREPDALRKAFNERVGRAAGLLHGEEIPDANALIEAVLSGTTRYIENMPCGRMDDIIGPLIQALYTRGHNDFFVDYRLLEKPEQEFDPTSHLAGTANRPLRATVAALRPGWFGAYTDYCTLRLMGDAEMAGAYAKNSEFEIDGSMILPGKRADSCVFRLKRFGKYDKHSSVDHCPPQSCVVYVEEEPDSSLLLNLDLQGFFFWHGAWENTLYAYEGEETKRFLWFEWKKERWKEVRP